MRLFERWDWCFTFYFSLIRTMDQKRWPLPSATRLPSFSSCFQGATRASNSLCGDWAGFQLPSKSPQIKYKPSRLSQCDERRQSSPSDSGLSILSIHRFRNTSVREYMQSHLAVFAAFRVRQFWLFLIKIGPFSSRKNSKRGGFWGQFPIRITPTL